GGVAANRRCVHCAGRLPQTGARRFGARHSGCGRHCRYGPRQSGSCGSRGNGQAGGGGGSTVNNEQVVSALLNVYPSIVPETVLFVGACVLFLGGTYRAGRSLWGAAALVVLAGAAIALWFSPHSPVADAETRAILFAGPLYVDRLAVLIKAVALAGGAVLVL